MIIGYTTGVYDLFHIGHLILLRNAKGLCDKLVVGVSTDDTVAYKNKKPVIPFEERIEIVRSIKYVDIVIPQEGTNKLEAWDKVKYDLYITMVNKIADEWGVDPESIRNLIMDDMDEYFEYLYNEVNRLLDSVEK